MYGDKANLVMLIQAADFEAAETILMRNNASNTEKTILMRNKYLMNLSGWST